MRTTLLMAGLAAIVSAPVYAQQANDLEARVTQALAPFVNNGFSGAVLVEVDGQVVRANHGFAIAETAHPVTNATVFDIGSVSKQFTKAAVLKLADQGRISLDDPIGTYFPDAPDDKRDISIQTVVDMRAGLHEYVDLPEEMGDFARLDRDAARQRILNQELLFPPGTDRAYSNSGYTLLALLVEEVSGQPFREFLQEQLLEPAGISRTGFYREQHRWAEQDVARGYEADRFGEVNSPYYWPEPQWALIGNGGMVSGVDQLHTWIQALRSGEVLSPPAFEQMYGGHPPTGPAPGERPFVLYAGANDFGFVTVVFEFYDDRGIVIVSTNNSGDAIGVAVALGNIVAGPGADLSRFLPGRS